MAKRCLIIADTAHKLFSSSRFHVKHPDHIYISIEEGHYVTYEEATIFASMTEAKASLWVECSPWEKIVDYADWIKKHHLKPRQRRRGKTS